MMYPMKVALVEPNLSGHHKVYLESFARVLRGLGHTVFIYSSLPLDDTQTQMVRYRKNKPLPTNPVLKKLMVGINLWLTILNLLNLRTVVSGNVDFVFFCCIDDYMNELIPVWLFEILFPLPFSGLLLSPRSKKIYFNFDRRNILRSKYCKSIAVLDEFCKNELKVFCPNIVHFPDFSDESLPNEEYDLVKKIREKAKNRKIISLLGAISYRKGVDTFVKTAKELAGENYFFVMAGKSYLNDTEKDFLNKNFANQSNCFLFDENIPTESDFNMLIYNTDMIYAAYVNFSQSSNMFAKASLFRKPLIVSKGAYMEEIVNKYSFGMAIEQDSTKECVQAIRRLSVKELKSEGYLLYLKSHSIENLEYSFKDIFKYMDYQ